MQLTTLCLLVKDDKILLAMKKRGFGVGKWNGYGGKIEEGETLQDAAIREMEEEAGIKLGKFKKLGILDFKFEKSGEEIEVHVFKGNDFSGEPRETEEMRPKWFHIDEIPFESMWPDDVYWMPLFLKDKKFKGRFTFGEGDEILEQELKEVEEI